MNSYRCYMEYFENGCKEPVHLTCKRYHDYTQKEAREHFIEEMIGFSLEDGTITSYKLVLFKN